jgi:hypothetical protein
MKAKALVYALALLSSVLPRPHAPAMKAGDDGAGCLGSLSAFYFQPCFGQ